MARKLSRRRMLALAGGSAGATALAFGRTGKADAQARPLWDELVGAWAIEVTSTSSPYKGVQMVNGDGTMTLTMAPSGPSASGAPSRLYATGYGVWRRTGQQDYEFSLLAFSVTDQGAYNGPLTVNGQTRLSDDAQSFQASYTSTALSADGGLVGHNHGTVTGTRVSISSE
jgi:hypothetical protein